MGHLLWHHGQADGPPQIIPAPELRESNAPATLLATLRHLVLKTGTRSLQRLTDAENEYWCFVEIEPQTQGKVGDPAIE